ncbi:MAG TPA: SDR family NAD(P)-dependent oxidoreductase [Arthrobacter sp.]|nr:SDR family NAD(P)-dependent oxidoreductase [Arthrobacter sp.]
MTVLAHNPTVLIAGATSPSGAATAAALSEAGASVIAVGTNPDRLHRLSAVAEGVTGYVCNLADAEEVNSFAAQLHTDSGPIDGLIHLVGGWRGGDGIPGQSDEDWDFLHSHVFTTLRNTSRTFYPDLLASDAGRMAIVSSTAAAKPTASGANYSAAKAAAEAWTMAVADGFQRAQSGRKEDPEPQRAAAAAFIIKALVDDTMRQADPERAFAGYTDVRQLGEAFVEFMTADAATANGTRIPLNN